MQGRPYDLVGAARARDFLFGSAIRRVRRLLGWPAGNGSELFCVEAVEHLIADRLPAYYKPGRRHPKAFADLLLRLGVTQQPSPLIA